MATKRKRTTTTALACGACRSSHLKCDGRKPVCTRCLSKGLECDWSRKHRKRGPVAGKLSTLEQQVAALSLQIKQKDQVVEYWKKLYDSQKSANEQGEAPVPVTSLCSKAILRACLVAFDVHCNPIINLDLTAYLRPTYDITAAIDAVPNPETLQIYGMLCVGALRIGNSNLASTFAGKCRLLLGDFFDLKNVHIAAGIALLGYFHHEAGTDDDTLYYCTMAVTMCRTLLRRKNDPNLIKAVEQIRRFAQIFLGGLSQSRLASIAYLREIANDLEKNFFLSGKGKYPVGLQYLTIKFKLIWYQLSSCNYLKERWNEYGDDSICLNAVELDSLLQNLNGISEILRDSPRHPANWKFFGLTLVKVLKLQIMLLLGRFEECCALEQHVKFGTNQVDIFSESSRCPWAVESVFCMALIHLQMGAYEKYQQDCNILSTCSSTYPLASVFLASLRTQTTARSPAEKLEKKERNIGAMASLLQTSIPILSGIGKSFQNNFRHQLPLLSTHRVGL
mmetsp:Transcript_14366/g.15928  ORF Transcript_14366/g.15928 Transcript_14366/m.15928 type:complete len:507 (-) Transcript_14366:125-1645(-)